MYSELFFFETISPEQEGWVLLTILGVGEAEVVLSLIVLATEDLHLVELADNELEKFSATLLEAWNSVWVFLFKLFSDSLQVLLSPAHKVLLRKSELLEGIGINDVDDTLAFFILNNIIGGNSNLVRSLIDPGALNLIAGVLEDLGVWVGIGEELVFAENAGENSHWFVSNYK